MNWSKTKRKSLSFLCLFLLITSMLVIIVPPKALAKQSNGTSTEVGTKTNQSSAISDNVLPTEEEIASGRSEVYKVQPMDTSVIDNTEASRTYSVQAADSFESQSAESKDGFKIKNKNGPFKASFAEKAGGKFLNFSYSNAEIGLAPVGSSSVKGEIDNDKITFKKIYPDSDIQYQLGNSSLKETIVVKKYTGKSTYDFDLTIVNAVYQKNENGEIVFSSPINGKGLFYLAKPFAVDSAGNRCDSVSLEILEDDLLRLSVDPTWLKNAIYPVMIDPTINLFDPSFTRASVAYTPDDGSLVSSNTPRYGTSKFGKGILIEEATTPKISGGQSDIEGTYIYWTAIGGVLSRSISKYWQGSKSMEYVTETIGDNYLQSSNASISSNTTYTYSAYVNIPSALSGGNAYLRVKEYDSSGTYVREQYITGKNVTSGWEREILTFTTSATTKSLGVQICQAGIGKTYYDGIALEQKSYVTSWQQGSYARNAETLKIQTSNVFNRNAWSMEMVYKNTCSSLSTSNMYLWNVYIDTSNYYSLYVNPSGTLYFEGKYGGTTFSIASSSGYIIPGTNYQIMSAFDGAKVRLCCNGSQIGTDTTAGSLVGNLPTYMYVGCYKDSTLQANGIIDDIRISNRGRGVVEYQAVCQLNKKLSIDASTVCKVEFDNSLHALPDVNSVNPTYTRNSVAYDGINYAVEYAANVPRYKNGKFNQGILIEEGTSNAVHTYGSTISYVNYIDCWYVKNGSLTREESNFWHSPNCIKYVTNTASSNNYIALDQSFPVSPNTTYTFSGYVNITSALSGGNAYLLVREKNYGSLVRTQSITGKNLTSGWAWEREILTFTTSASTNYVEFRIYQPGTGTSYWDGFQFEQYPYATSWMAGNSVREAEVITLPTDGVFNRENWSVEMVYKPTCSAIAGNNKVLYNICINSNNHSLLYVKPTGILCFDGKYGGTSFSIESSANYVVPGTDYQIMITFDGTNARLFCNGLQIGSDTTAGLMVGVIPTNMCIGSSSDGTLQANGIIDDLRISGKARTLSEHQIAYQSGLALPIDLFTTCKMAFDSSLPATVKEVSLLQYNYYNYGSANTLDKVISEDQTNNTAKQYNFIYDANGNMIGRSAS